MSVLEYKFLKINNTNKFKVYLITFISNFIFKNNFLINILINYSGFIFLSRKYLNQN